MTNRFFAIVILLISVIFTNNIWAQWVPVSGINVDLANTENVGVNIGIAVRPTEGYRNFKISGTGIWGGQYYNGTVFQMTNDGVLNLSSIRPQGSSSISLLRNNITYATMSNAYDNYVLTAKNNLKIVTNGTHEITTFYSNKVSFYENLFVEKDDITVSLGLNDLKSDGWIGTRSQTGCYFAAGSHNNMYMDTNNGVYIGGISGADVASYRSELKNKYKLFVKNGVLAEDFAIAPVSSWADFVFHRNYNLRPLTEVEQFIEQNKHLPEVPSATKVAQDGYSQHEMNKILLQKIEELTLYTIQQQKEIEELRAQLKKKK